MLRARRRLAALVLVALSVTVVGCAPRDGGATGSSRPSTPLGSAIPSPAEPDRSAAEPGPSDAPPVGQTETEWGVIWDGVPAGFPRYPGGTAADDATPEAVSDAYAVPDGDPAEMAMWFQTQLEGATYSTEALSGPLEDGSFLLDSVGEGDCRIQTTIAPLGSLILVTVRYGAGCPAA